ncbi:MAG: class III poly(R)-hydroxyalkanoic acid synthase subunit PhaC [Gammaproteobacteria bacterium]|nr:class III poly(R)-hydroxyalkanoic acid synthase subunit PhaC [Gammaproteobacteria bacterium]
MNARSGRESEALVERLTRLAEAIGAQAPAAGATPRELVHREDTVSLYHYPAAGDGVATAAPLLIVYALVNRPYMADLEPERSLIRALVSRGLEVYLLDWGDPGPAQRYLSIWDYVGGYLDRCVDVLRARTGREQVNVLGVCQGGTLSLCYAALFAHKVSKLITTVTPVDFHTPDDLLSQLVRHVDVDQLVATLGNVPGELLNFAFLSLRPFRLGIAKYLDLLRRVDDADAVRNFARMERWIFDSPDQPGEVFRQFVQDFYQRNALVRGELRLGERAVNLAAVTMPVLNVYAREDHLVPPAASLALEAHVGTRDYTAVELPGGHIGLYVSSRALGYLPDTVAAWLAQRAGGRRHKAPRGRRK